MNEKLSPRAQGRIVAGKTLDGGPRQSALSRAPDSAVSLSYLAMIAPATVR
jgi:hypothetical protein